MEDLGVGELVPEGDVLPDRVVEQERLLEHQHGRPGETLPLQIRQETIVEGDLTHVGVEQPHQEMGDRRLSRARRPHDGHRPTRIEVEIDPRHPPTGAHVLVGIGQVDPGLGGVVILDRCDVGRGATGTIGRCLAV